MAEVTSLKSANIAIVCCGLGHVHRGVEVWAEDLASELAARGVNVTLFKGGGSKSEQYEVVVPCVKRGSAVGKLLTGLPFPGKWRTPLVSPYMLESFTFARNIIPQLAEKYDIVHAQDPYVARILHRASQKGVIKAKVILANGTEETPEFLAQFDFLQELDDYGIRQLKESGYEKDGWFSIPNFVDTDLYHPLVDDNQRQDLREKYGVPGDAYVVLAVGAVQRQLKRTDWLIKEFADFHEKNDKAYLVIVGAGTEESDELKKMARTLIGDDVRIIENIEHDDMPGIYRMADVFAFCVVHGIYGIALAEAAATGLPCVVHDWERVKWVAGPCGTVIDMEKKGELAAAFENLNNKQLRQELSEQTRVWAVDSLSKRVVVGRYVEMYEKVL